MSKNLLVNEQAGIRIGKLRINNLFYADDLLLLAMDELELNSLLLITENYGLKYEIKFNHDKTMFMILGMNKNQEILNKTINIRFQGELIERVKEMRFLGSIITDNLKSCNHIKSRKSWEN